MESTTSIDPNACKYASQKHPRKLLCDLVNAVIDANGELLQYLHLIDRPEYRAVWGKAYAKELGRLAQGLPGVVDVTDTIDLMTKYEVPFD